MPKLPILNSKEVVKILEQAGFTLARQKGSHCIYTKGSLGVVVPWHNKDLKKGTLKHIIKQSGLSVADFSV